MVCSTLISVNTSSEYGFYRFNLITLFMLEMAQKQQKLIKSNKKRYIFSAFHFPEQTWNMVNSIVKIVVNYYTIWCLYIKRYFI